MSKKRQYKSYSQEFKEEAIALVTEQGYSVFIVFLILALKSYKYGTTGKMVWIK